jgi:hypothetical protein
MLPPPPPDLNCDDIGVSNFTVLSPDPHGFDGNDNDGIGCESESDAPGSPGGGEDGGGEDNSCHPSYPDVCIPPPPPDLDCGDEGVPEDFEVVGSDPHGFDGNDNDGIGCESESDAPDDPGEEPGGGGDDDSGGNGGDDDDDGDNGSNEEPEPEPGGGGDDDSGGNGGDGDEGEDGGGGEEGNPNEFDDCVVPPGSDPGDVGC